MSKEIPILFSTPMVQAILEGRKTMTRRIVKRTALQWLERDGFTPEFVANPENSLSPYGKPGDLLWVREKFVKATSFINGIVRNYHYATDGSGFGDYEITRWCPSIHMPKDGARIWLEVTDIRVERLQDITPAESIYEGIAFDYSEGQQFKNYLTGKMDMGIAEQSFQTLWQKINGSESWTANPWVWVVSFKVLSTTGKPMDTNHIELKEQEV